MPGLFDFLGDLGGTASGGFDWGSLSTDFLGGSGGGFDWSGVGNLFGGGGGGGFDWSNLDTSFLGGGSGGLDFSLGGGSGGPFSFTGPVPQSWDGLNTGFLGPTNDPNAFAPGAGTPINLQTIANPLSRLIPGSGGTGPVGPNAALTHPPTQTYTPGGLVDPITGQPVGPQVPGGQNPFNMNSLIQALSGAGLLAGLTKGNDLGPDAGNLRGMAKSNLDLVNNSLMPTALANQQGMINGPALNAIERRLQKSEAGMRGKYAEMGASGSTMEQEDLADLRQKAQDEIFATGQEMATTGLQTAATLTGQSSGIYEALMQAQVQQDEELAKAIAAFAGAAAR